MCLAIFAFLSTIITCCLFDNIVLKNIDILDTGPENIGVVSITNLLVSPITRILQMHTWITWYWINKMVSKLYNLILFPSFTYNYLVLHHVSTYLHYTSSISLLLK